MRIEIVQEINEILRNNGIPSRLNLTDIIITNQTISDLIIDNGKSGGSFEEMFEPTFFIDICFAEEIMTSNNLINKKEVFLDNFDKNKSWFSQVKAFCVENEYYNFKGKKVKIAEELAGCCEEIPQTMILLADFIRKTRKKYPVIHPDCVELEKIPGLTC